MSNDDAFFVSLLRSSLSERKSQSIDGVSIETMYVLPWDVLKNWLGEENLNQRTQQVLAKAAVMSLDERSLVALQTAEKYTAGWRPPDFPGK